MTTPTVELEDSTYERLRQQAEAEHVSVPSMAVGHVFGPRRRRVGGRQHGPGPSHALPVLFDRLATEQPSALSPEVEALAPELIKTYKPLLDRLA